MKFRIVAILVVSIVCFSSCERTVVNHGYLIETVDFSTVKVGTDNSKSVFKVFGEPTIRSSIVGQDGSYSWYYVSKRVEKTGAFAPKVVAKKTMIITFNRNDIVTAVKEGTGEKDISIVRDKTATGGKTAGVAGEAFGGFGKYIKRFKEADEGK
jgi:outer membrane protein assembly factor BamE (lipoprotein component of BamABCDE complex)